MDMITDNRKYTYCMQISQHTKQGILNFFKKVIFYLKMQLIYRVRVL